MPLHEEVEQAKREMAYAIECGARGLVITPHIDIFGSAWVHVASLDWPGQIITTMSRRCFDALVEEGKQ